MPLDMSIYSRVAQPDLTNALQSIAQIPQQRAQNRLLQMQMQAASQKIADDAALRKAYQTGLSPTGEIDYGKAAQAAAASGSGTIVPELLKQQQEQRALKIKTASDALTLQKHYAGKVMASPTLANATAALNQLEAVTGPGSMDAERQQLAQIGDNPEAIKAWAAGHAMDAEKLLPHFSTVDVGGELQQVGVNPVTGAITQGATIKKTMAPGQAEQLAQQNRQFAINTGLKRQEIAATQANQAQNIGMKRQELEIAKTKAANEQADRAQTKQGAVASYDTAIDSLNRLKSHPGMSAAVGAPNPLQGGLGFATIRGTPAADFEAELETFKSQTFLPMVQNLKGMGALSDAEGKKLSAAVGALDPRMGEGSFQASIDRIMSDLTSARARAASTAPAAPAPAASGGIPADIQDLLSKHGGK